MQRKLALKLMAVVFRSTALTPAERLTVAAIIRKTLIREQV
jgi:hypothetical protein